MSQDYFVAATIVFVGPYCCMAQHAAVGVTHWNMCNVGGVLFIGTWTVRVAYDLKRSEPIQLTESQAGTRSMLVVGVHPQTPPQLEITLSASLALRPPLCSLLGELNDM